MSDENRNGMASHWSSAYPQKMKHFGPAASDALALDFYQ